MGIQTDVKAVARSWAATDNTYLTSAQLYTSDQTTLASTFIASRATFAVSDGFQANNITLTATVDMSARTFTVIGVNNDGATVTETITGPNNSTVSGTVPFRSISAVNSTGGPTDNLSIGIGRVMGIRRSRVKGIMYNTASHAGSIEIRNGVSTTGILLGRVYTATVNTNVNVEIPGQGIRCDAGTVVNFSTGVTAITVFYA